MAKRLFVVVAVLIFNGSVIQGQAKPSIQGVWRVVEQTINDRTLKDATLGVGFHIYTARHYAIIRETGVPPRMPAPIDNASAAQLMAAYGPFVAQFGTYELSGERMSETILIAKNPELAGQSSVRQFQFEGNTLVTEPIERTPGARSITLKMVRVE